jgi:hypothetical protein
MERQPRTRRSAGERSRSLSYDAILTLPIK